jgi:dTDP-4-dehydrorhamnose 3,5-epimerase-like enzyme
VLAKNVKLSDITRIKLEVFKKNSGKLVALQHSKEIPWNIERVFFITTRDAEDRGDHAHIDGSQAFLCIVGSAHLVCKDGIELREFKINPLNEVVVVPPGIWVNINLSGDSALAVMTDLPYDENDYITQWDDFLKLKGLS